MSDIGIQIFADCADLDNLRELVADPSISGVTTNPTLLRKAGVTDYLAFAKEAASIAGRKPISFEVFADDFAGMERQALILAELGENVFVKIPITTTNGAFTGPVIATLSKQGVRLNVTAIFTRIQLIAAHDALRSKGHILSVFMGRIRDTGEDGINVIYERFTRAQILWASSRSIYDVREAESRGYQIITLTPDLLAKLALFGKNLEQYSRETVQMFYNDAQKAGYVL